MGYTVVFETIFGWFLPEILHLFFLSIFVMDLALLLKNTGRVWWRRALVLFYGILSILRIVDPGSIDAQALDLVVFLSYGALITYPMLFKDTKWGKRIFNFWAVHAYFIIAAIVLYVLDYEINLILSVILIVIFSVLGYFAGGSKGA